MSWLLDLVPVVGTVKNTIECVDCLVHGDGKGALSKGVQAVIGGALDVMTFGTAGSVGKIVTKGAVKGVAIGAGEKACINVVGRAALDTTVGTRGRDLRRHDFDGLVDFNPDSFLAREVRQGNSRSTSSTRQNESSSSAGRRYSSRNTRESHPSEISHQELAQLRRQGRDPDRPEQEKNPSRRGEHVVNNGVLRIYEDAVRGFVTDVLGDNLDDMVNSGRLSERSAVIQAIRHPIPERIADFIQNQLVIHMTGPFKDTNAVAYGEAVQRLREVVVSYMEAIFNSLNNTEAASFLPGVERNVRDAVEDFIAGEYFIDENAREIWRSRHREGRLDEAIAAVESMLRKLIYGHGNDMVIQWVRELRDAFFKRR